MMSENVPRTGVGEPVELIDVTGDWPPGTVGIVLRCLHTHVIVAVLDEQGRQVETVPVGYGSFVPREDGPPEDHPHRRPLVTA